MSEEFIKSITTPQNILILIVLMALCIFGVLHIVKVGVSLISKIFSNSEDSNIELGNGLFKFSTKRKPKEDEVKAVKGVSEEPSKTFVSSMVGVTKNNIINCMTQSIDEVINYYTETNEIKNQLLKSQLANTKRMLNPISFTFTQAYKTQLERKNKDNASFDIRYDDSSWFFGKLIDLDFETIIMKELDEAYSRNHLVEKNEEEFQAYGTNIARRCVKAFEASMDNYRNPVDLIIARVTFEDNKDELFKQILACIDDAKRQSEENKSQIVERNTDCNKKLIQIMTINIPDIKSTDLGQIVGL